MKRMLLIAVLVGLVFALPAAADKPVPTLTVTPDPVVENANYTISGCGFKPGTVTIKIFSNNNDPGLVSYQRVPGANGCIADGTLGAVTSGFPQTPYFQLGDVLVTASQAKGGSLRVVASTTFTIIAA